METCSNCMYSAVEGPDGGKSRVCRRNAPPAAIQSTIAPGHGFEAWWPIVLDADWCGEWAGAMATIAHTPTLAPAGGSVGADPGGAE